MEQETKKTKDLLSLSCRFLNQNGNELFRDVFEFTRGTQEDIVITYLNHMRLLLNKNRNYGNSALEPLNIFSRDDSVVSLYTRIDDKLSRIRNSLNPSKNDVSDLIGYLMLLCVHRKWLDFDEMME